MRIRIYNTYEPVTAHYRDLIPYMADLGVEIEVIVSGAEYRQGRDIKAFLANYDNISVRETPTLGLKVEKGLWAKATITALYFLWATLIGLFGRSVDKNLFFTQPPLIGLLGSVLSKVRRQPYACIVMDIYPQIATALGAMQPKSVIFQLTSTLARIALRHATGVIVIGRCMRDRLIAMGIDAQKIHVIQNWANSEEIFPVNHEENRLRQALGWKDKFVVLYAGNIGGPQHFADLLSAADLLQERSEILFALVGEGSRTNEIVERISARGLANVVRMPFLHQEYPLSEILSAGDIHFLSLRDGVGGLAVPSKSYGILAAGRAMIYQGEALGEIALMIGEEEIGAVVPLGQSHELAALIECYAESPELVKAAGAKARSLAEGKYGLERALQAYGTLLLSSSF